ncbi:MAG: NAD-dependent DNA ligase LigA [Eubacterium sp.]|nr:NAD-dependent DNA ligase LigA [Eubacterium sp.]
MVDDKTRMHELIDILDRAGAAYYSSDEEIMSNYEYDRLYDELVALEEKTGIVLAGSPTVSVGYETMSELAKEAHVAPMLSLGKTKSVDELTDWIADKTGLLSMKLDGLSVIITYENGKLVKALTRGNGEVGEVITSNAKTFKNLPGKIPFKGRIVLRGEALIRYSDFDLLTKEADMAAYKNPRNLCSGSVRNLNTEVTAKRRVRFYAYNLIDLEGEGAGISLESGRKKDEIDFISNQGFETVPFKEVSADNLAEKVEEFRTEVENSDLPSDGLVLTYDDIEYSKSLGRTAKAPRDSIALKWQDETAQTTLREIEWSASRTGLINPVAIFDPVELEGTTVRRASVHNVSILEELKLGLGDTVLVYKANMIIPQISDNLTKSGTCKPPEKCPVCGGKTSVVTENGSSVLMCENPECFAKKIHGLSHFVSRDALGIDGLSEATLEKWISRKYISSYLDIFNIEKHKDEIINDDEMKIRDKSYANLTLAIENAKDTTLPAFIYALGIKGVGLATAKDIVNHYPDKSPQEICELSLEELTAVNGIGENIAGEYVQFFADENKKNQAFELIGILRIQKNAPVSADSALAGKNFVITGSLEHFSNRSECKNEIEALGGKVVSAVSANTDFLVNNDVNSTSSKNKKAKELGIPIISEEELRSMMSKDL